MSFSRQIYAMFLFVQNKMPLTAPVDIHTKGQGRSLRFYLRPPEPQNLITGIATAYMDSILMVVITGQVSLNDLGKDVFQEASEDTGACESFVKA